MVMAFLLRGAFANAGEKEPEDFDGELTAGEEDLKLRGHGAYTFLAWDVLYVGLYVPDDAGTRELILDAQTPKALVVHYNWEVSRKDISSRVMRAMKREPNVDLEKVGDEVRELLGLFPDAQKGDSASIAWVPAEGLTVTVNGEKKESTASAATVEAFFRIWLSEKGMGRALASDLLGEE
jgi:hypothetical protein